MKKIFDAKLRCKIHRTEILNLSQKVQALHIGGSFSSVEIVDCIYNICLKKKDKFNLIVLIHCRNVFSFFFKVYRIS